MSTSGVSSTRLELEHDAEPDDERQHLEHHRPGERPGYDGDHQRDHVAGERATDQARVATDGRDGPTDAADQPADGAHERLQRRPEPRRAHAVRHLAGGHLEQPVDGVGDLQTGAGVGGYQVAVTQLANSAQRTFTYTPPASADTITIDGHSTQIAAGATIQDFVNAINQDSGATVYAAATDGSTVVLSDRATGDTGSNFIQVTDPGGALVEQTALAKEGKNAEFSVDGTPAPRRATPSPTRSRASR